MKRVDDLENKDFQIKLREDFIKDGFIFFPGFLNEQEIRLVKERLNDFITTKVPAMPSERVYYEDKEDDSTLKQLQHLHQYDPFFFEMMFGSRFEKLAAILLDDDVEGKNMQYFNKPPKIGKPTPAHQDGYYFMLEPNEAVTMWMALEKVDEENGCVKYVKGSHKIGMREHGRTNTLGFSQGIVDFGNEEDLANEVFFPTKAGDLLVHHSLTIHFAEGNNSTDRTRKAMGFIYYAEKAKEDLKAHEEYQKKLTKDLALQDKL